MAEATADLRNSMRERGYPERGRRRGAQTSDCITKTIRVLDPVLDEVAISQSVSFRTGSSPLPRAAARTGAGAGASTGKPQVCSVSRRTGVVKRLRPLKRGRSRAWRAATALERTDRVAVQKAFRTPRHRVSRFPDADGQNLTRFNALSNSHVV